MSRKVRKVLHSQEKCRQVQTVEAFTPNPECGLDGPRWEGASRHLSTFHNKTDRRYVPSSELLAAASPFAFRDHD